MTRVGLRQGPIINRPLVNQVVQHCRKQIEAVTSKNQVYSVAFIRFENNGISQFFHLNPHLFDQNVPRLQGILHHHSAVLHPHRHANVTSKKI